MNTRRSTFRLTPRGELVRDLLRLSVIVVATVATTLLALFVFGILAAAYSPR